MEDKQQPPEYLFVYGSLRKGIGHPASSILQKYAELQCDAEFQGELFVIDSYPGAIQTSTENHTVKGELYLLKEPSRIFQELDHYEDYDPENPNQSLFIRSQQSVKCAGQSSRQITAWVYLYNRPTQYLTPIPSGDYLTFLDKQ